MLQIYTKGPDEAIIATNLFFRWGFIFSGLMYVYVFKDNICLGWVNPGEWYKYSQKPEEVNMGSGICKCIQAEMK